MKKSILKPFFPAMLVLLGNAAFCQAHQQASTEPKTDKNSPISSGQAIKDYGYPVKKNTGSPDTDYAEYRKAKIEWIRNNPETHKRLTTITPASPLKPERKNLRDQVQTK